MTEGYRVEELDLNQRVLRVNIEVDVYHDVEDDNETENDKVRANALDLSNHIDRRQ